MNNINIPSDFVIKQENLPNTSQSPQKKRRNPFGEDPFTEHQQSIIRQKLDVGLSRNETSQRPGPGGMRITYIEGWKVIHDANQIFGFNGWSSKIVSLDQRYIDESRGRFSACFSASVRVTLRDGSSREDRGGGLAENIRSKGEAILKAEKEAITDATKRALKNFGLRLGLSLYDRQHVREMNRPQPPTKHPSRVSVDQVETPVQTRPSPHNSRFQQKPPAQSPVTPATAQAQAFQKVKNQNPVSSTTPKTPIDTALAAKVAANRQQQQQEEALLRKQVLQQQRVRANQSAAVSNPMAVNAYQNAQPLQTGTVDQMAARHLASVGANFQRSAQPVHSNAFSAGVSAAHTSAHLQPSNNTSSRATNQALPIQNAALAVQQQYLNKQRQYSMRGNVNPNVANNPSRRNPNQNVRPSTAASNRSRSAVTSASLGVDTTVAVAHAVDAEPNIQLDESGPGGISMKQTEIDELSAIALADF